MNSWELHIENASCNELGWIARELVDGVCSQNLATMLSSVTTFLYLAIPRLSCNVEIVWLCEPNRCSRGGRKGGAV